MKEAPSGPPAPPVDKLLASCQPGLKLLLEAVESAKELGRDLWDFAVEVHNLRAAGLSSNNLRWLLCKGYVEHAVETTRAHAAKRTFRQSGNLMLSDRSCFVLTPAGIDLARGGGPVPRKRGGLHKTPDPSDLSAVRPETPRWNAECRELRWGETLVKRFRVPALNQERVLATFEEEGWPTRIDDPLPAGDYDSKQRLQDTIKRLNKHQVNHRIHFRGNGSGNGIIWEILP